MPSHHHPAPPELVARLHSLETQITALRRDWESTKATLDLRRGAALPEEALFEALESADLENARLRLELASAKHQLMQTSHLTRKPIPSTGTVPAARRVDTTTEVKSAPVDWDLNTGARARTGFEKSIFGILRGYRG